MLELGDALTGLNEHVDSGGERNGVLAAFAGRIGFTEVCQPSVLLSKLLSATWGPAGKRLSIASIGGRVGMQCPPLLIHCSDVV